MGSNVSGAAHGDTGGATSGGTSRATPGDTGGATATGPSGAAAAAEAAAAATTAVAAESAASGGGGGGRAVRTKDWQLSLHVVEDRDTTRVHAVLDADGNVLHSDARSRRNPRDTPAPQVGDEFAVGRALVDLGHQLLRAGVHGATGPAEE
ncbi:dsRBD fold-containing protein [Kitasatospora sp. NPDC101447]|uniref:dsRBD fold-containing protein n=1 Tax=Kitasatospora sp. NPDC101447 TaxID=3364102 RepID=UPI003816A055